MAWRKKTKKKGNILDRQAQEFARVHNKEQHDDVLRAAAQYQLQVLEHQRREALNQERHQQLSQHWGGPSRADRHIYVVNDQVTVRLVRNSMDYNMHVEVFGGVMSGKRVHVEHLYSERELKEIMEDLVDQVTNAEAMENGEVSDVQTD